MVDQNKTTLRESFWPHLTKLTSCPCYSKHWSIDGWADVEQALDVWLGRAWGVSVCPPSHLGAATWHPGLAAHK